MLEEAPRIGEPESALIPGMSAPIPRDGLALLLAAPSIPDTSTAAPTPPGQAAQGPPSWVYDIDPATGVARASFNGEVSPIGTGAYLALTGGTLTGNLTVAPAGNALVTLQSPLGNSNQLQGARPGTGPRWSLMLGNTTAESGTSTGSDFTVGRFDNTGAALDVPFSIARATGVATFTQPIVNGSDRAFKRNVEPIRNALARVCQLQGVAFDPIGSDHPEIGLIAQDVLKTVPEVVHEIPALILPDGATPEARKLYGEPRLGIAYAQLTAILIEAVKQLASRLEALEASPKGARR